MARHDRAPARRPMPRPPCTVPTATRWCCAARRVGRASSARRRRLAHAAQAAHWRCKLPVGFVPRGRARAGVVNRTYNARWSVQGVVERAPMSTQTIGAPKRAAGARVRSKARTRRCSTPRVKLLTPGSSVRAADPRRRGVESHGCARAQGSRGRARAVARAGGADHTLVHIDRPQSGWRRPRLGTCSSSRRRRRLAADGRRRVVRAAAAAAWVRHAPVASDLGNLSDAVRWVRANGVAARRMADAAAKLVDEALSARAWAVRPRAPPRLRRAPPWGGRAADAAGAGGLGDPRSRFSAIETARAPTPGWSGEPTTMDCAFADQPGRGVDARAASFAPSSSSGCVRRRPDRHGVRGARFRSSAREGTTAACHTPCRELQARGARRRSDRRGPELSTRSGRARRFALSPPSPTRLGDLAGGLSGASATHGSRDLGAAPRLADGVRDRRCSTQADLSRPRLLAQRAWSETLRDRDLPLGSCLRRSPPPARRRLGGEPRARAPAEREGRRLRARRTPAARGGEGDGRDYSEVRARAPNGSQEVAARVRGGHVTARTRIGVQLGRLIDTIRRSRKEAG